MCCFIVPLVQAVATTAFRARMRGQDPAGQDSFLHRHISDLEKMLWGGTLMLIVDHVINGELTWRFPFFTALGQTGGWEVMLREMLTVGVPMSLVLTLAWALWAALKERRAWKTA
ncbi:MAG: hypothetical protein IJV37_07095 [Bacteroidales bacterium]|nr:hypothetical protein [Bacteroidales bacterium]